MNIEEEFNKFYTKFLNENKNILNDIELKRKNATKERNRNKIIIFISEIIILILVLYTIILSSKNNNEDITTLGIFCLNLAWIIPVIISLINKKKLNEYDKVAGDIITDNIIKAFGSNLKYYPNETMDYNEFKEINSEHFNSFHSANVIRGNYMHNEILISKIIAEYSYFDYSSTENGYGNYEIFDGLFAKIKLSKTFNEELYLKCKETISQKMFNTFVNTFVKDINQVSKSKIAENNLKKHYNTIKIDELNNAFSIYCSNTELAQNILDAEISKILFEIYNKEKFELTIKENSIYFKFFISGLFSAPSLKQEVFDKENIYKNYRIFYIIFYLTSKFEEKL